MSLMVHTLIYHYVDYMNINDPLQYVCGIINYSVHELHLLI